MYYHVFLDRKMMLVIGLEVQGSMQALFRQNVCFTECF